MATVKNATMQMRVEPFMYCDIILVIKAVLI